MVDTVDMVDMVVSGHGQYLGVVSIWNGQYLDMMDMDMVCISTW